MTNEEIGKESLMAFIKALERLIKKGSTFDLIIGAGDSGQAMVRVTNEVFKATGQKIPMTVVLPIYRHTDDAETMVFDNNYFSGELNKKIYLKEIKNILLVDDEVGNGMVVSAVSNLIRFSSGDDIKRTLAVVAEDQGYTPPERISEIKIDFIPTKKTTVGIYNAISLIVTDELRKEVKSAMEGLVEYPNEKLALNALLGLPIKNFNNGSPIFSDEYLGDLKKRITGFEEKQKEFNENLQIFIKSIIVGS